jgi:hypothetical protein
MDPQLWWELFSLFIAMQSLYVSENMVHLVGAALQWPRYGWSTNVFPVLRSLYYQSSEGLQEGYKSIRIFVAAQLLLSDHPIALQEWDR